MSSTPTACHLARIAVDRPTRGMHVPQARIVVPTLADFLQARLRTILAPWREEAIVAAEVRRLAQVEGLPGIALWFDSGSLLTPRPLPAPIQPLELHEADPQIIDVARASVGPLDAPGGLAAVSDGWSRGLLRAGLTEFQLLVDGAVLSAAMLMIHRFDRLLILAILASAVLARVLWSMLVTPRWWIEPGGLTLRRPLAPSMAPLRRFTPRDTVMIIRRGHPGWRVALYTPADRVVRLVTTRELIALLSAWMTPSRPGRGRLEAPA